MPIRLEGLLSSFRRHLHAAHKAPRTIELYSQSVRYFSRWLAEHDRPATLDELTRPAISAWLAELSENCQASTVATRLPGMRRFCRWLVVEGELDKAPTEGIEIASIPDKPVPILSDAEITALLKTCAVGRGRSLARYSRSIRRCACQQTTTDGMDAALWPPRWHHDAPCAISVQSSASYFVLAGPLGKQRTVSRCT